MTSSSFPVSDISDGQEWRNAGFKNTAPLSLLVNFRNEPNEDLDAQYLSLLREKGVMRYEDKGAVGNRKPEDLTRTRRVHKGDVIVNSMNFWIGSYGISPFDGVVSTVYHIISPNNSKLDTRYLNYWFGVGEFRNQAQNMGNGILPHRRSISQDRFGAIRIPLPHLETQRRIADYLDKEISEMDTLIEEFEGLAKNLGARRGQLVNRIINKHASVQAETGYPWERYSFKLLVDSHFAGDWGSDIGHDELDLPCVRVADFNRATSSLTDEIPTKRSYSKSTYEKKHLVRDDLLVEKSGGGEKTPVGSVVLYQGDTSALCANFIEVIRLRKGQVPRFWVHMFRANFVAGETFRFVKQTTGIQNLDMQMFLDQKFVVPPAEKQREIADELDREFERMDALIEESTRLIENLKARKTALITEVVTGRKEV